MLELIIECLIDEGYSEESAIKIISMFLEEESLEYLMVVDQFKKD